MSNVSPAFFADLNIPPIIRFMTWMFYAKYIYPDAHIEYTDEISTIDTSLYMI